LRQCGIVLRAHAAGPGPLDGTRFDQPSGLGTQKALGRRARHYQIAEIEVGAEWSRIAASQAAIQVERRPDQWRFEPLREVGLEDVTGVHVLDHARYGIEIPLAREVGADAGEVGHGVGGGG